MSMNDVKKLFPDETGEIEKAEVLKANTKPAGNLRPSDHLVSFHLQQSLGLGHLGAEPRVKVADGSIDLYNRLKVRDPIDSIYSMSIVVLLNASMRSYSEAARSSRSRDENLDRAYKGTALLMDVVMARENRRALLDDRNSREEVLQELMRRYGLADPPVETET